MMLNQTKRIGVTSTARRRQMLALLLDPIAGCASRGGFDPLAELHTQPPVPPTMTSSSQEPPAGQTLAEEACGDSFVAVPTRLGVPDQSLPDWTPELHQSRTKLSKQRHQDVAAPEEPLQERDAGVATVAAITELLQADDPVSTIFRPAAHRMQLDESADPVIEMDTMELASPSDHAQREAEFRLAEARRAEEFAAADRRSAETELETRIQEARQAALRAEQLAALQTDEPTYVSMGAENGLEPGQPIDLGAALGMAGGNAWTIQLARQKTVEAHAEVLRAESIWLPTLQLGVGWNKHEGRIQTTEGNVIEASRDSVFLGGGATLGRAPVAGGSGGPFRLMADVAVAEAFFGPKIARRNYHAERFGVSVAKNQAMLQAGTAYINLLEAAGQVADAQAAIAAADELVQLTRKFEEAGAGAQADVDRAVTERSRLQQTLQNATRMYRVHSASLAQRLRLNPTELLQPADEYLVPVSLTGQGDDPSGLISTALSQRPEICEQTQRISALCMEYKMEQVAPWIPSLTMATSAGMFSGGTGSRTANDGGRGDIDVQAIWELENMGRGVAAKRKRVASRLAQQRIVLADIRDQIRTEVVQANENVANYWLQIQSAESALEYAESSYQRNLLRVRNAEGLPIELLQAINARTEVLRTRTSAVADYNRAQLELLFAIGQLQG